VQCLGDPRGAHGHGVMLAKRGRGRAASRRLTYPTPPVDQRGPGSVVEPSAQSE
jgi:hypothetical protein